jgi:uncharacterized membrane protein YcaP (DUF421 family)
MDPTELHRILLGEDNEWPHLLEFLLRSVVMFALLVLMFKLTGKKEARQLTVLELIVVVGLGSAAGDPMFYREVGVLPAAIAIAVVLVLYRVVNQWTNRHERMGQWLEGTVRCVLRDGRIDLEALHEEGLSRDELLGDLRVAHVEHLGQVRAVHIEVSGEASIFFRPAGAVVPGLPIAPGMEENARTSAAINGARSCCNCGHTEEEGGPGPCAQCGGDRWLPPSCAPRIT